MALWQWCYGSGFTASLEQLYVFGTVLHQLIISPAVMIRCCVMYQAVPVYAAKVDIATTLNQLQSTVATSYTATKHTTFAMHLVDWNSRLTVLTCALRLAA